MQTALLVAVVLTNSRSKVDGQRAVFRDLTRCSRFPRECGSVADDAPISVHRDIAPSHARGAIWPRHRDCDAFGVIVAENFLGRG
jgi:hypothetical protein